MEQNLNELIKTDNATLETFGNEPTTDTHSPHYITPAHLDDCLIDLKNMLRPGNHMLSFFTPGREGRG